MKLKPLSALWILLLLLPACILAQYEKLLIGFDGGSSLNTLNTSLRPFNKNNFAVYNYYALSLQVNLSDYFALASCPNYELKGTSISFTDSSVPVSPINIQNNIKLGYFELPLMARVYYGKTVRGYLEMGSYMAYLKEARLINKMNKIETLNIDITGAFVRFNGGAILGIGAQFQLRPFIICTGIRSEIGISNIIKSAGAAVESKTITAKAFIGCSYRMGRKSNNKP